MPARMITFAALLAAAALAADQAYPAASDFGFEVSDQHALSLVASVHLHNAGTSPAENIEVIAYLPRNLVGQTIYALDFMPPPQRVETDLWKQKLAKWKIKRLNAGEHFFALWVAQGVASEVKFDVDRLRKGDLIMPLPIRSRYLWSGAAPGSTEPYFERCQLLAAYVRKTISQELSGLPFYEAIPRPESSFEQAAMMTKLSYANEIPCRTIGAYVKAASTDFSIDLSGTAWNEIYFPQSGWVPMSVSDPRDFGRRHNNGIVVKTAGHSEAAGTEFWGVVNGGGDAVRVVHRGYFSAARDFQRKGELIELFQSLMGERNPPRVAAALTLQGQSGDSLGLGPLEPYLYHADQEVVESAASAIGAIRQKQAVLMLVDAMGRSPEIDEVLVKNAESLTGRNFGTDKEAWRAWIRDNLSLTLH